MRRRAQRASVTALAIALFWIVAAAPGTAQTDGCTAQLDGQDLAASTLQQPLEVVAKREAILSGDFATSAPVRVDVEFAPIRWTVITVTDVGAGGRWERRITASDYVPGVGLYRFIASSDEHCAVAAWIRVVGADPLTTTAGAVGAGALVVGLALQALGVLRGGRLPVLGGPVTGVGLAVLLQQFAIVPLGLPSLVACGAGSSLAGAVARRVVKSLRRPVAPRRPSVSEAGELRRGNGGGAAAPPPQAAPMRAPELRRPNGGPQPAPAHRSMPRGEARSRNGGGARAAPRVARETAAGEAAMAAAAPAELADPPRSAYGLLRCPEKVVAGREFELVVGLSPRAIEGVAGGEMVRPGSSVGPYTLTAQVVADGFALRAGESWRHELRVIAAEPYPTFTLHLAAEPQAEDTRARKVEVHYSVGGQPMGFAFRVVTVAPTADVVDAAAAQPADSGARFAVPAMEGAPDLTVRITFGVSESRGRLLWSMDTPHASVRLPDAAQVVDIGDEPAAFARRLVAGASAREGKPGLFLYMKGIGRQIAQQLPGEFWRVLREVHAAVGRAPTILFLSEEPYVPWELAVVEPPLDPGAPPFLSAQANVGRWTLGEATPSATPRPPVPPPASLRVTAMAVVWGVYNRPNWRRLVEAEKEAEELRRLYSALEVDASSHPVLDCIRGTPPADLLHFAIHGIYDPESTDDGLILVDGLSLAPDQVMGADLGRAPFVFLNACQVGSGSKILGDYAGMAHAFLYAGASGVIAPLWNVRDSIAREIALRFYERVFDGDAPAEVLRRERAAFTDSHDTISATFLAYQYFGHPVMRLTRA